MNTDSRPTDANGLCACAACRDPNVALAEDLEAEGLFCCATCKRIRLLPAATQDDADCVGDPPRMVPCGNPVCGPCAHRAMPEAPKDYFLDGTDEEFRDCCGGCSGYHCACRVEHIGGFDRETGPYDDDYCLTHNCRA